MPNEGCCVNAIVSRSDPCCAQRWAMWFDLNTNTLKIMDDWWIVITWGDVKSVNDKTWTVVLTPRDILWDGAWYYTDSGWRQPAQTVLSWSDSLITSGAVYTYLTQIISDFDEMARIIEQWLEGVVKRDPDIVKTIWSLSTDLQIPTAKTVYDFVNNMNIQWVAPIQISSPTERTYNISVAQATHDTTNWHWVCRLANIDDYNSYDWEAALTSDVIKPIIDDIDDHINDIESQVNENETNIEHMQNAINTLTNTCVSLQQQIDELRALIPNP